MAIDLQAECARIDRIRASQHRRFELALSDPEPRSAGSGDGSSARTRTNDGSFDARLHPKTSDHRLWMVVGAALAFVSAGLGALIAKVILLRG